MDAITYDSLTTVGGLSIVVWMLTQATIRLFGFGSTARERYGPILAISYGVIVAVSASIIGGTQTEPFLAAITGIITGGTAMGLHDTASTVGIGTYD
jgi:hypothetical protein